MSTPAYPPPRSESHHVVRERVYPQSSYVEDLLGMLRLEHATGNLVINLNQGGVARIAFEEKERIVVDNMT